MAGRRMKASDTTALLVLVRWQRAARLWGMLRLPMASLQPLQADGLLFHKVLGSGRNGGFGLTPSFSHMGLFAVFEQRSRAEAFLHQAPLLSEYRARAAELAWLLLRPYSVRGAWSGFTPQSHAEAPQPDQPIASLTRASIRPTRMSAFWSQSPAAEADLSHAQGCQLSVGLGEAPLLRQATFSLWRSVADMNAYARSGAHLRAIQTAYREAHFSESMFVRFTVLACGGAWQGSALEQPSC